MNFLRGQSGMDVKPPAIAQTPENQWVSEAPQTTAPMGPYSLYHVFSGWLGDPVERYGPLEISTQIPLKRKVVMMKDPILSICIGYVGSMLMNAKRVIVCQDAAKQRFFEAMFRDWEKEYILNANIGIALGSVGMLKKWRFEKPKRVSVEDKDPWTGKATPYIIAGFDIMDPLSVSPNFDKKGRVFEGIETADGALDVFYSLWLTLRKELAFGSYWGVGRLDHCYKDWWMSEYGADNYIVAMQKESDRVVSVGYPPGKTGGTDNQATAVLIGDRVRSGATVAFPTSVYKTVSQMDGSDQLSNIRKWTLEFLEGSGSFQRFHEMDDHHSRRKALGYFVPPQTLMDVKQASMGGISTAQTLGDISAKLLLMDAADIDRHLNEYVFPAVSKANFPPDSPEVRVVTTGLDANNKEQLMEIIKALSGSDPDITYFDMRQAMERLDFPLRTEDEVAKKKAAEAFKFQQQAVAGKNPEGDAGGDPKDDKTEKKPTVAEEDVKPKAAADEDTESLIHGDPLPKWPVNKPVEITPIDIAMALADWQKNVPEEARGLLLASNASAQTVGDLVDLLSPADIEDQA